MWSMVISDILITPMETNWLGRAIILLCSWIAFLGASWSSLSYIASSPGHVSSHNVSFRTCGALTHPKYVPKHHRGVVSRKSLFEDCLGRTIELGIRVIECLTQQKSGAARGGGTASVRSECAQSIS